MHLFLGKLIYGTREHYWLRPSQIDTFTGETCAAFFGVLLLGLTLEGNGASGDDTMRRGGYVKSLPRLTSIDEQARILPHLRRQSYHLQKESTQHHNLNHLVVSYRACLRSSSLTA